MVQENARFKPIAADRDVKTRYIDPASPWQNAFGESFNRSLRDERLDLDVFHSLGEAKTSRYNHSSWAHDRENTAGYLAKPG